MFKQFINYMAGADLYMVSSFLLFFIFFIGVSIWLVKADKNRMKRISEIPLND
jgi:cbb3-type cytochrome oxidase subunit 3